MLGHRKRRRERWRKRRWSRRQKKRHAGAAAGNVLDLDVTAVRVDDPMDDGETQTGSGASRHARAQYNLGVMYANGDGVPQDYAEAVKWYRLAAEQGHAKAQNNLGVRYYNGKGVLQDYARAHMWFILAAAQGDELARETRDLVAERMTPTDISKAQKLAREWMEKHAE